MYCGRFSTTGDVLLTASQDAVINLYDSQDVYQWSAKEKGISCRIASQALFRAFCVCGACCFLKMHVCGRPWHVREGLRSMSVCLSVCLCRYDRMVGVYAISVFGVHRRRLPVSAATPLVLKLWCCSGVRTVLLVSRRSILAQIPQFVHICSSPSFSFSCLYEEGGRISLKHAHSYKRFRCVCIVGSQLFVSSRWDPPVGTCTA